MYWLRDFRGIKSAVRESKESRILVPSTCRTIASICSAVSVERFNFPGGTSSVFLFGDFRTTPAASEKGRIPTPSTCRSDRAFALRFFRAASPSSVQSSFFFCHPTRLSGAVWMGDRFEAIRLFQRNEFTLKKKEPDGEKGRSMAYCAVSHVVWLFRRGTESEVR